MTPDRWIILIVSVTILAAFLYGGIDYGSMPYAGMDLKYYRSMASQSPSIAQGLPRPFCYRLLGPWTAGLFPDDIAGFRIVTILSSLLLAVLFYRLLLSMSISSAAAASAVIFFVLNKHLFGISAWNYFQVKDTLSLAFIAAMMLAMYRHKWALFSAALFGGALTGELPMIMIPVLFVFLVERGKPAGGKRGRPDLSRRNGGLPAENGILSGLSFHKWTGWVRFFLVCLPGLAVFIAIRTLVPSSGGIGLFESVAHYSGKLRYPMVWYGLLGNPFIPLTLLPLIFFRESARFLGRNLHMAVYFVFVLAAASFGSNNERLMAPAFIVFYAIIAFIVDSRVLPRGKIPMTVLFAAAILSSLHHAIARFPLPDRRITIVLSGGSLLAVSIIFLVYALHPQSRSAARSIEKQQ